LIKKWLKKHWKKKLTSDSDSPSSITFGQVFRKKIGKKVFFNIFFHKKWLKKHWRNWPRIRIPHLDYLWSSFLENVKEDSYWFSLCCFLIGLDRQTDRQTNFKHFSSVFNRYITLSFRKENKMKILSRIPGVSGCILV
jgi:hypothetical protein